MSETLELTLEDAQGTRRERARAIDLYNEYAREKHDVPVGWHWYELNASPNEVPKGFYRIRGAVAPLGPRTGRPDWKKEDRSTRQTLFVERAAFEAWKEERGQRLNQCPECLGSGDRVVSAGVTGTIYRQCERCVSTGEYLPKS